MLKKIELQDGSSASLIDSKEFQYMGENKNIITIDGPAASGKTSIAQRIAKTLDYSVVYSGLMYRAFSAYLLENNVSIEDIKNDSIKNLEELINQTSFESKILDKKSYLLINGNRYSDKLENQDINNIVSYVAKISPIRQVLNQMQRNCAYLDNIICEGRDAGTVVFPYANNKFYIKVPLELRALRRKAQGQNDDVKSRDNLDSNRVDSPLTIAKDAIIIDNFNCTIDETIENILSKLTLKK